jgi:glutamate carboxypeptidase
MDPVIAYLERQRKPMVQTLRRFVECESPTSDPAAVRRFAGLVADEVSGEAKTKLIPGAGGYGPHLQCEFNLGGRKKPEQILVLGHLDTVWPNGVLRTMPFKQAGGRLWGPGVLDMKGGIAMFLYALRAAREAGVPVRRKILLQLNSDEETGSHSSRPLTEKEARHSAAVLVLEPGTGLEGKLKTARKGGGVYRLKVIGRASHAGVDFPAGASAILELAR